MSREQGNGAVVSLVYHLPDGPKRLFARASDLEFLREQLTRNRVPQTGKADKHIPTNRLLVYIFLFFALLAMIYVNIRSIPR